MDPRLDDIDRLFRMAGNAGGAPALAVDDVMRRIHTLPSSTPVSDSALPLRFLFGVGAAAATIAVVVSILAFSVWDELHDPLAIARFLPDVMRLLEM